MRRRREAFGGLLYWHEKSDVYNQEIWRSRPDSSPEYRAFGGIVIEGIEDLVRLTGTVA